MTSTKALNLADHRESGRLGEQAREIVTFLARHTDRDWSRSEIAEALHLRLSSVCARVNELLHTEHVEKAVVRKCQITGKTVATVRLMGLF